MGHLVAGMLRVGISVSFAMGVAVAVQALGAFRTIKFMSFAGTETEYDQDGE